MTALRQAQDLGPRDIGRTVAGLEVEGTWFTGPLVEGTYGTGPTIQLIIGRQHHEVWLTQPLEVTGRKA